MYRKESPTKRSSLTTFLSQTPRWFSFVESRAVSIVAFEECQGETQVAGRTHDHASRGHNAVDVAFLGTKARKEHAGYSSDQAREAPSWKHRKVFDESH